MLAVVDCHNPEIKSILTSKSVKLQVFPPWGVCLALQLKDGQQHWSLLTGICVGVRRGAHEHTVHSPPPPFYFSCSSVCMCVCAMLVADLTYVWCLHMFLRVYTIVS